MILSSLKNQQGFLALISVIIILAVLLIIAVSISFLGFFSRFNVSDAEYKKRSSGLAEACIDTVLLRLANDSTDTTTGNVPIGIDSCDVISVQLDTPSPDQTTIQTKSVFQKSVTNIRIIINSGNFSIISWEELPTL